MEGGNTQTVWGSGRGVGFRARGGEGAIGKRASSLSHPDKPTSADGDQNLQCAVFMQAQQPSGVVWVHGVSYARGDASGAGRGGVGGEGTQGR